jgi:hypothetical protein
MLVNFFFRLGVLAALVACLCVSVGRRHRAEEARRRERARQSPGTAFDVSAIAPRIQQLRQDYLAAPRSQPGHLCGRNGLLAVVRRWVANLSYFRRAGSGHEMRTPDAKPGL